MKTLVLGIGNPILSDDGVGIKVARQIEGRLADPDVTVAEASVGGLGLLDLIIGYDRVVIIDAIQTKGGQPGTVYHLQADDFACAKHTTSPHDMDFATALKLGKLLGMAVPPEITIFAVEVEDVTTVSEQCTPKVDAATPVCVDTVLRELGTVTAVRSGHL